ncbi:CGNR zinc finger domain-containing protein [Paenarthrobacter sp. NPDC089322]|uniref:CGNR zinc finger domain-containing protein n=1 Tax=Paenarthrobacter sp. NPDC089322 TaxID=3155065 RepID=UPI00341CFC8C
MSLPLEVRNLYIASDRYSLKAGSGNIGLVQDFVNTISAGRTIRGVDLLDNPEDATAWASAAWQELGVRESVPVLDNEDLEPLRRFRSTLMSALAGSGGTGMPASSGPSAAKATLSLEDGQVRLASAAASGYRAVVAEILRALYDAQLEGESRRLKICPNEWCRVAFYDRSKNNGAIWHDSSSCGNIANVRASRARQRDRMRAQFSAN